MLPGAEFVSDAGEALRSRPRGADEPVVLFYEKTSAEADRTDIARLSDGFPLRYFVLVSESLCAEERKLYLKAGVHHAVTPRTTEDDIRIMLSVAGASFAKRSPEAALPRDRGDARPLHAYRIPLWKRAFDIVCSGCALIVLSPLLLGVALAIRLESRGPVFYRS